MWVVQVVGSNWLDIRATRITALYLAPMWQSKARVGGQGGERGTTGET